MGGTTRMITDINKHGIRRERPAVGYKAVKKFNKKNNKKNVSRNNVSRGTND